MRVASMRPAYAGPPWYECGVFLEWPDRLTSHKVGGSGKQPGESLESACREVEALFDKRVKHLEELLRREKEYQDYVRCCLQQCRGVYTGEENTAG